jgi:hypothetical protein
MRVLVTLTITNNQQPTTNNQQHVSKPQCWDTSESWNNFQFDGQMYYGVVMEPMKEKVKKELKSHNWGKVDEKKPKLELLIHQKDELKKIYPESVMH